MGSVSNVSEARRALLVMDLQNFVLSRFPDPEPLLQCIQHAIATARAAGIPVIYVTVAFRPGHPEVNRRNQMMSRLADSRVALRSDPATAIHPRIEPQKDEVVLVKYRVSAFSGSELELILRSAAIDTLVLTGITTSGVVLSTVRDASDRDYRLIVLSDGCADPDPEVHSVLLEKVLPRQAQVLTVEEWASSVAVGASG